MFKIHGITCICWWYSWKPFITCSILFVRDLMHISILVMLNCVIQQLLWTSFCYYSKHVRSTVFTFDAAMNCLLLAVKREESWYDFVANKNFENSNCNQWYQVNKTYLPKRVMKIPPKMGSGMVTKRAPNLPNIPSRMAINAPTWITRRLAT